MAKKDNEGGPVLTCGMMVPLLDQHTRAGIFGMRPELKILKKKKLDGAIIGPRHESEEPFALQSELGMSNF